VFVKGLKNDALLVASIWGSGTTRGLVGCAEVVHGVVPGILFPDRQTVRDPWLRFGKGCGMWLCLLSSVLNLKALASRTGREGLRVRVVVHTTRRGHFLGRLAY
jgi:hypothetical protein